MELLLVDGEGESERGEMPEKKEGGFECLSSPKGYLRMISSLSLSLSLLCICDYTNSKLYSSIASYRRRNSVREREGEGDCVRKKRGAMPTIFFSPLYSTWLLLNLMFSSS